MYSSICACSLALDNTSATIITMDSGVGLYIGHLNYDNGL